MLAGGHFCNKAEQNYSPIEGEATAVAKGLQDTKYYAMGCKNLYVATDHSALVTVLREQSMADVENHRLARIKEKTLWWQFKILHTPGKKQLAADALSRRSKLPAALYRLSVTDINDDEDEDFLTDITARIDAMEAGVHAVMRTDEINVITWNTGTGCMRQPRRSR